MPLSTGMNVDQIISPSSADSNRKGESTVTLSSPCLLFYNKVAVGGTQPENTVSQCNRKICRSLIFDSGIPHGCCTASETRAIIRQPPVELEPRVDLQRLLEAVV